MVLFLNWAGKMQVYHKAAFERAEWQEALTWLMGRGGDNVKNLEMCAQRARLPEI